MDLKINYALTRDTGTQVISKAEEFQSLLNKIKATNNELQSYWEGSDAVLYSKAVEEQSQTMQQLCDTINEIGEFLVKTGDAYQKAMEANQSGINM